MRDSFGRNIDYMRISITDRCNLRCNYCMPEENAQFCKESSVFTVKDIAFVVKEASELGITSVKITGGEPLMRDDVCEIIKSIKGVKGIENVTLTTNGVLLKSYAKKLFDSGIDSINVSLDSLNKETYKEITGFDTLEDVLCGIAEVEKYNIPIKINTVLRKGINESEFWDFAELAVNDNISVRFIELMPIGRGKEFEPVKNEDLLKELKGKYVIFSDSGDYGNGPATYYKSEGFKGRIGFISPVHNKFCHNCNRIRLTATGGLKGCLAYGDEISIAKAVRCRDTYEVKRRITLAIAHKPPCHHFENPSETTEKRGMYGIGG